MLNGTRALISRAAVGILRRTNLVLRRRLYGRPFRIPVLGVRGLGLAREREPEMVRAIGEALNSRSGAFIDVGANLGQTLLAVQSHGYGRQYVGFEPNPICCAYILELVRQNAFKDVTVLPLALSDTDAILPLNLDEDASSASASLTRSHKRAGFFTHSIHVICARGDDVLNRLGVENVGVLKIDVEGLELHVLNGLEQAITRDRPPILIEVLGPLDELQTVVNQHRIANAVAVEKWARARGYSISVLVAEGIPRAVDSLAEAAQRREGSNYLLLPQQDNRAERSVAATNEFAK